MLYKYILTIDARIKPLGVDSGELQGVTGQVPVKRVGIAHCRASQKPLMYDEQ